MKMRIPTIFAVIFILTKSASSEFDANDAIKKTVAGIDAGKGILEMFEKGGTSKIAGKISKAASKIAPFLGAFGPALSLVNNFIQEAPTQFQKDVAKNFSKIDQNFDKVFEQFHEVKSLILETSLKFQYARFEHAILWQSKMLHNVLTASRQTVEDRKGLFLQSHYSHLNKPTWLLYRFMMKKGTLADNIPALAMKATRNHRKQVQRLLLGVLNLIIQGVKVHLAHLKLKAYPKISKHTYDEEEKTWAENIKRVVEHIKIIDSKVKAKWKDQYEEESLSVASRNRDKGHSKVAKAMYDHLSGKYDWRAWFVVVYDPITGSEHHEEYTCGFRKFRYNGMNILVASSDVSSTYLTGYEKNSVDTLADGAFYGGSGFLHHGAYEVLRDAVPKYITTSASKCSRYRAVGVIKKSANAAYVGPNGRFTTSDTWQKVYKVHLFV